MIRGTDISSFDVEVIDVLRDGPSYLDRILIRVSGPAVDATGLGPGFSGSPIYCPGAGGPANAGAISEGVGDYGNKAGAGHADRGDPARARRCPAGAAVRHSAGAPLAGIAR